MSQVRDLRWQSGRNPERPIKHLDEDGRITRTISLQGVYRLTGASACILEETLDRTLQSGGLGSDTKDSVHSH